MLTITRVYIHTIDWFMEYHQHQQNIYLPGLAFLNISFLKSIFNPSDPNVQQSKTIWTVLVEFYARNILGMFQIKSDPVVSEKSFEKSRRQTLTHWQTMDAWQIVMTKSHLEHIVFSMSNLYNEFLILQIQFILV